MPSARPASGKLDAAFGVLDRVFGKKAEASPRETKDVVRDLEKVLSDRLTWTMEMCRAIGDRLLVNTGARRRSAAHERAFFMLLGEIVEHRRTEDLFLHPSDQRTAEYVEGRYG